MKHLTSTLTVSALLMTQALADDKVPPVQPGNFTFEQLEDHFGADVDWEEPPIIIDRGPGAAGEARHGSNVDESGTDGAVGGDVRVDLPEQPPVIDKYFEALEDAFNAAGADLVAASDAGAPLDLEPFREAVAKWKADAKDRALFMDLDDVEPPLIIDRWTRDLWARGVDVVILRRFHQLRADAAEGTDIGRDYDELRMRLAHRSQVLEESSDSPELRRLEQLLDDAEGAVDRRRALLDVEMEFTRQRAMQALRIARARQAEQSMGLSDRERFQNLLEYYHRVRQDSLNDSISTPQDHPVQ